MHCEVHCSSFKLYYEALHLCVVYGAALPNSSGAPVLDDTCNLQGVHIGTSFHLGTTHQPAGVLLNLFALVLLYCLSVYCATRSLIL